MHTRRSITASTSIINTEHFNKSVTCTERMGLTDGLRFKVYLLFTISFSGLFFFFLPEGLRSYITDYASGAA